jgi:hypothetical protein
MADPAILLPGISYGASAGRNISALVNAARNLPIQVAEQQQSMENIS